MTATDDIEKLVERLREPTGLDRPDIRTKLDEAASTITSLQAELAGALKVLRDHHEWHSQSGTLGLPDGEGGWIEVDNAAEYGDSRLYQRTVAVLDKAPPVFKPLPRGGRASNHWENWQLAYREMKAQRKRAEAAEAELAVAREALTVKPLEWHQRGNLPGSWEAESALGMYRLDDAFQTTTTKGLKLVLPSWRSPFHSSAVEETALDEAKAAAQADYEKRIRSALATP